MTVTSISCAVEDPLVAQQFGLGWETFQTADEPFFLDGPVGRRVAVVDRDPSTAKLAEPVLWDTAAERYAIDEDDETSFAAMATSVFGIVLETVQLFERKDVLGHSLRWAFESPQLLVVPRAGDWANAFYDRYSQSLQFFSFQEPGQARIYTALSRDIVAHETGHAILDSLAPALYDALTPETLALHEGMGDMTAIVMALRSPGIRDWLIRDGRDDLSGDSPVTQLATQFGEALREHRPLRDVNNQKTMDDIGQLEPHAMCEVLTGALWSAMVTMHRAVIADLRRDGKFTPEAAFDISARRITRVLFRALDYLPPAEATFADYARALLIADSLVYPEDASGYRRVLRDEFVKRRIVRNASELAGPPQLEPLAIGFEDVLESDWAAYQFVEKRRELLGIPRGRPFRLFPRRDIRRLYYIGGADKEERREMVLQVTWEKQEPNRGIAGVPRRRSVFQGTTLIVGGRPDSSGRYPALSCLSSDGAATHAAKRNDLVRNLAESGSLLFGGTWTVASQRALSPIVFARSSGDLMRLRGTARLLHLAEQEK